MSNKALVKEILMKENITTWYQPIVDTHGKSVLGWEGLTRGPSVTPLHSAAALFQAAQETGKLKPVELMCLKNAGVSFEQLQLQGKLFVNVSHELFLAGNHLRKQLAEFSKSSPIPPNRVVVELTEQSATTDLVRLIEEAEFFHSLGFEIAIDDLGVGQISHIDWMKLKPDYVKVSRQFINNIEKDQEKINIVKSIVSAANSAHARVIALGVETVEELAQVRSLGISLCEGYLFERPQLSPNPEMLENIDQVLEKYSDRVLAYDLIESQGIFERSSPLSLVIDFFEKNSSCNSIAIINEDKSLGLLSRAALYGRLEKLEIPEVASFDRIEECIKEPVLITESSTDLVSLSKTITARPDHSVYDDFIVCNDGEFIGIGSVVEVMRRLTICAEKTL